MFENIFSSLSRDEGLEVAYYVTRLLTHRRFLALTSPDSIIRKGSSKQQTESVRMAIGAILDQIKDKEKTSIEGLDDSSVNYYLKKLEDLINDRSKEELNYGILDGKKLLRNLREHHG